MLLYCYLTDLFLSRTAGPGIIFCLVDDRLEDVLTRTPLMQIKTAAALVPFSLVWLKRYVSVTSSHGHPARRW